MCLKPSYLGISRVAVVMASRTARDVVRSATA